MLAACIFAPLVIAPFFWGQSLRLDESQSLWQTARSVPGVLQAVASDVHVPLYHLLLHAWLLIGAGDSSVAYARLLSLLFFVLSIPVLYALGERAYGRRAALIAVALYALSPFMNWYANEIRMYSLFALLALVSQYLFFRIAEGVGGGRLWALYGLTAVLGVYTDYFFLVNLGTQFVFAIARRDLFPRRSLIRLGGIGALLLAALAPWLWYVHTLGTAGFEAPTLPKPSFVDLFSAFSQFFFGFQVDAINTIIVSLWPVLALLALASLRYGRRMHWQTEFFGLVATLSVGTLFFASFIVAPMFLSRYLIFALPALYLILGSVIDSRSPRVRMFSGAALAIIFTCFLVAEVANPATPAKENYAGASAFISAHASAQDVIIVSAPFTIYPMHYYYHGPAKITTLPLWNQYAYGPIPAFDPAALPEEVRAAVASDQNAYVLLSYDQGYEDAIRQYFDTHYARIDTERFSNNLELYVYRLRYDTDASALAASF